MLSLSLLLGALVLDSEQVNAQVLGQLRDHSVDEQRVLDEHD